MELIDLLHGLKPPTAVSTLRSRFACFHKLMVQTVKVRFLIYDNIPFIYTSNLCQSPYGLDMKMCSILQETSLPYMLFFFSEIHFQLSSPLPSSCESFSIIDVSNLN